jgi:hypothetical protein
MAPTKPEEKPKETKEEEKPLANGVKKDEPEELVTPRVHSHLF